MFHTLHLRPSTGHRRTSGDYMYLRKHASSSFSLSLSCSHACHRRWTPPAGNDWIWNFTRVFWNRWKIAIYIYIPLIIADNRLRRRYRSAKMEILVSKFDAAFKGFAGSFKRLLWAEITPRPVRLFAVNDKNRRGESFITRATFEEY